MHFTPHFVMQHLTTARFKLSIALTCVFVTLVSCGGGASEPSIGAASDITSSSGSAASIDSTSPTVDIASLNVDTTSPTVDVASLSVDTTSPTVDVASLSVDTTSPTVDVANLSVDTSSPTVDTATPTVVSTTPSDDARRVEIDANILAEFDAPLLLTSLDSTSFKLSHAGTQVPAQITLHSNTAILNPDASLLPSSFYNVTLDETITDISGNPITKNQWSFFTDGNGWIPNAAINPDITGYANEQEIGVDSAGNAIVVWQQTHGSSSSIYASRYDTLKDTWSTTQLDGPINADYWIVSAPNVNVNAAGHAIVNWASTEIGTGKTRTHLASWYDPVSNQWARKQVLNSIGNDSGHATWIDLDIDLDDEGNAVALWIDDYYIYSSQYDAETDLWGTPEHIGLYDDRYIEAATLSTHSAGNVYAVWSESNGWIKEIYANRYDSKTGQWGSAQIIVTSDSRVEHRIGWDDPLNIGVDQHGNAIVVWHETRSYYNNQIRSSRYDATSQLWSTAQLVASQPTAKRPRISINANGNAIAVWEQMSQNLFFSQYDVESNDWTTAQNMHPTNSLKAVEPQISINSLGNTLVVWSQYDGSRYRIFSSVFDAQTDEWADPQLIETNSTPLSSSRDPKISKGSQTGPIVVWSQLSGSSSTTHSTRFEKKVVE